MNYSSAIFLVNDAARAIAISYDVEPDGKGKRPFTVFKSLDPSLAVGQYVTIPTDTRHGMTVVRIEEVNVDVDQASPVQLQWIIGPVQTDTYKAILAQEASGIAKIKSAEKLAAQKELRAKLLADNPDIQSLAQLDPDSTPALAAPPT